MGSTTQLKHCLRKMKCRLLFINWWLWKNAMAVGEFASSMDFFPTAVKLMSPHCPVSSIQHLALQFQANPLSPLAASPCACAPYMHSHPLRYLDSLAYDLYSIFRGLVWVHEKSWSTSGFWDAAHISKHQDHTNFQPALVSHTPSIWDAEETCDSLSKRILFFIRRFWVPSPGASEQIARINSMGSGYLIWGVARCGVPLR